MTVKVLSIRVSKIYFSALTPQKNVLKYENEILVKIDHNQGLNKSINLIFSLVKLYGHL